MNPFSLQAVFWREFGIFLLATSMMTIGTIPMAAHLAEKYGRGGWLLVLTFPAFSAFAGLMAYREERQYRGKA